MIGFEEFFSALWGFAPHPWQAELAARVREDGRWPHGVSAGTGLGKTACIDIAVWALADDVAARGVSGRSQPLRIALGVERRLVVDSAGARAASIAAKLEDARGSDTALGQVADALAELLPAHAAGDPVLATASLHGGVRRAWFQRWERATGALVVTGTMTQITSRVLMRGVGETVSRRPMAAGVLGVDCLRLCDEPHLSDVAVDTLIAQQGFAGRGVWAARAPQTVVLGATVPPNLRREDRFVVDPAAQGTVRARPPRPARLLEATPTASKPSALNHRNAVADLIAAEADAAWRHDRRKDERGAGDEPGGVVVIVSTTAHAEAVSARLRVRKTPHRVVTSRVRPCDRDEVRVPDPDAVLVATQTLESGVDFDARVIVSDLAPLPSLLQRAGRCNRRGLMGADRAETVVVLPEVVDPGSAAVYGTGPLEATAKLLRERCCPDAGEGAGAFTLNDFNAEDHDDVWPVPVPRAPLTDEMVDLLSDTRASAPWEQYLTGLERERNASVRVCFRDRPQLCDRIAPREAETVELPLSELTDSLKKMQVRTVFRVRPGVDEVGPVDCRTLIPGDTVVVPAHGGARFYTQDRGWSPDVNRTGDVTDVSTATVLSSGLGGTIDAASVLSSRDLRDLIEAITDAGQVDPLVELPSGWSLSVDGETVTVPGPSPSAVRRRGTPVLLADHLDQVRRFAAENARVAGFSRAGIDEHGCAGLHHDLGKVHAPYQRVRMGNVGDVPWAKSVRGVTGGGRDALGQWRHEAVIAARMRPGLAAYLVATHHGRGVVTRHCDETVQVLDTATLGGTDVWSLSSHSAVMRDADWAASAAPDPDAHRELSELGLEVDHTAPLGEVPEPSPRGSVHRLTGLVSTPGSGALAAYGVLAAVVAAGDTGARLRMSGDVFEIATTVPLDGSVSLWTPVYGWAAKMDRHQHLPARDIDWGFASRATDLLWCGPNEWAKKKGEDRVSLASAVCANGSPVLAVLSQNDPPAHWYDVLTDPSAGWMEGKLGGFDGGDRGFRDAHGDIPLARPAVIAWAGIGQWSWGQPQSDAGAGVTRKGSLLTLPTPQRWSSAEQILAMARRGDGEQWRKSKATKYHSSWTPTEQ